MKIRITEFGARHFDHKFGGTKILNKTKEEVEKELNKQIFDLREEHRAEMLSDFGINILDGYADFCKLVAVKNFTNAKVGSMPITIENYQYLRSGYSARRENELPVFSRWLELPIGKPRAEYLMFVLYSKEQIDKEAKVDHNKKIAGWATEDGPKFEEFKPFDADWGVVAILGQSHSEEESMKPETMLRNALGVEEGGSGVPIDRVAYMKSVDFWSMNATVK